MRRAPWDTIGLALFSWASWVDGERWLSGVLAGVVICALLDMLTAARALKPPR